MIETLGQFNARHLAALPEGSWERERIERLECQLAERDAEIARFRSEGVLGVMHAVDKAFYDLVITERNYHRIQVENRDATIAQLSRRLAQEA